MAVAQLTQAAQIAVVGHVDPAFALHRLHQHRRYVAGLVVVCGGFHRRQIVIGQVLEAFHQRLEAFLHLAVAGGGQGRQGAAMEAVLHHQNARCVAAALVAVQTRQLDRRLVGFGAGIGEEHLFHAAQRAQARGQVFLGRYPVQVRGVHQLRGLIRQGAGHRRMGVAQVAHGDAGHGVHKTVAVRVV